MRVACGIAALTGLALFGSACTISPAMERARPVAGSFCPDERLRRDQVSPADTARLRWYRAEEDRDARLSASSCSAVGPPAIRVRPAAPFPAWQSGTGVDVVSWNARAGSGDIIGFLAQELGLDCTERRPRLRPDARPFVLLLQDAWRRSDDLPSAEEDSVLPGSRGAQLPLDSLDVVGVAEQCGLAYLYVPSSRNGSDSDRLGRDDHGNAILTTLPFSAPIAFELPHEGGRKVSVAVTSNAPGGARVRFVATQLNAVSSLFRTLVTGNQTRAREALGLIDGIAEAEEDGPLTQVVVVGGDFKAWAGNESALQHLRQAFPQSPPWDGLDTYGSSPADHIFFRRRAYRTLELEGYERIEATYGSHHHARRATLADRSSR